jgi:hypothetical protein
MGRIRDLNRYRKVYPFSRARKVAPEERLPFRRVTGGAVWAITIDGDDYIISVENTAGGTATLPVGNTMTPGDSFIVKDAGGNAVPSPIIIAAASGDTIDGAATHVIGIDYGTSIIIWMGAEWGVF